MIEMIIFVYKTFPERLLGRGMDTCKQYLYTLWIFNAELTDEYDVVR